MTAGTIGLVLAAGLVAGLWVALRPSLRSAATGASLIAFSRGGPEGGIYVMNSDGTGPKRLTSEPGDDQPAWSGDGTRLSFVRFHNGNEDIYTMNADGSGLRRLTSDGASSSPTWSPDGATIAFARETSGNADIYAMDADGSHVRYLTDDPLLENDPAWSPDGAKIAFVGFSYGRSGPSPVRLYVMAADGSGRRVLPTGFDVAYPSWSPDGAKIAFTSANTGSIYLINSEGTGLRQVVDLARLTGGRGSLTTNPTWSPDGAKIAFATGPQASSSHIYVVKADGQALQQLTQSDVYAAFPVWSPIPISSPHRTYAGTMLDVALGERPV